MAQRIEPRSHFVEVNGQKLHYRQWSEEGPPLVLLHGVTSSSTSWDHIAPEFASRYRVMALDLRGHGQSSKPARGYTWADHYAADVVAFVKGHLEQPAFLVGHSLGAMVTVPVAVGAPDMVRAIVLEDPPAFPSVDRRERFQPTLQLKRMPYQQRLQELLAMGLSREVAVYRADNLEAMSEQVLVELMEGNTAYQADAWFPRVSCPALVILGNPDRGGVVRLADRPRLARLLKGARIVEWADVGHGVHSEQPQRFVSEVMAFLDGLAGQAG